MTEIELPVFAPRNCSRSERPVGGDDDLVRPFAGGHPRHDLVTDRVDERERGIHFVEDEKRISRALGAGLRDNESAAKSTAMPPAFMAPPFRKWSPLINGIITNRQPTQA